MPLLIIHYSMFRPTGPSSVKYKVHSFRNVTADGARIVTTGLQTVENWEEQDLCKIFI